MPAFDFDLHLNAALTDEQELIVMARMDDVSPARSGGGGGYLSCTVDADTLAQAVIAAAAQLHALIPTRWATGLGLDDTVTLAEAARRTPTRTEQSLRMLANGRRGPGTFPAPVAGPRLYSWARIAVWLRVETGDDIPVDDPDALLVDRLLAARAAVHAAGAEGLWRQLEAA